MNEKRPKILYILSSERSGSTLIDMVLGGNNGVVSTGEFHHLPLYARERKLCTCGEKVTDCSFWTAVASVVARRCLGDRSAADILSECEVMLQTVGKIRNAIQLAFLSLPIMPPWNLAARVIGPTHTTAIENSWVWHEAIHEVTGCEVVVESTKDVRRMKEYVISDPSRLRVLHLTRDGRAVTASALRRTGCSMYQAAENWKRTNRRIEIGLRGVPLSNICRLRYEDFCSDVPREIGRIMDFLGIYNRSRQTHLEKSERHNIGGNPMRFDQSTTSIVHDLRWKNELTPSELADFGRVAGRLNARLGYEA